MAGELSKALAKARSEVRAVEKRGTNQAQRYSYVTAEDVIREARRVLAEADLVLTDEVASMEVTPIESSGGTAGRMTDVRLRYTLRHTKSGEASEHNWIGTGSDYPGDKATYKAITGAHKYFLLHLLEIPIGDDPEDEAAAKPRNGKRKANGKAKSRSTNGKAKADPAPEEVVSKIGKALGSRSVGFGRLCTLIGSVGGDAPKINRGDSIGKAVRELSADQARQLLEHIEGE